MKKYFLKITFIFALILLISACRNTQTNETSTPKVVNKKNAFNVAMECNYPPFSWIQSNDENGAVLIDGTDEYVAGYDVEIAKKIAEGLKKDLVITKVDRDSLITSLSNGEVDAIISALSPTEENVAFIDFSESYHKSSSLVMIVKKGSNYEKATSIDDFSGSSITAIQGNKSFDAIDQIKNVNKVAAMSDLQSTLIALKVGLLDGYVTDYDEGLSIVNSDSDFVIVSFDDGKGFTISDDNAISVGVNKGDKDIDKINEILNSISEDERASLMESAIKNQITD